MRFNLPFKWEYLGYQLGFETYRVKVPGGWLIRTLDLDDDGNSESMVFISDPNHEWRIIKEPEVAKPEVDR